MTMGMKTYVSFNVGKSRAEIDGLLASKGIKIHVEPTNLQSMGCVAYVQDCPLRATQDGVNIPISIHFRAKPRGFNIKFVARGESRQLDCYNADEVYNRLALALVHSL